MQWHETIITNAKGERARLWGNAIGTRYTFSVVLQLDVPEERYTASVKDWKRPKDSAQFIGDAYATLEDACAACEAVMKGLQN